MKKLLLSFFMCMLAIIGMQAAEEATFTVGTDITATTATLLNGKIELSTKQNGASSAPAYNEKNKDLRLYYGNGNGCSATLTTDGTIKITSVKLTATGTSYTPTVNYRVDDEEVETGTWSSSTMTISGIEAKESFMFQNANIDTNIQLRIKSITITYESILDDSTPFLKADVTELAFRTKPGEISEAKIVTLTTANLKNLAYQLNGSSFAVHEDGNDTYSVTFTAPAEECTKNGTLVFSADDVEPVTINLTGVSSNTTLDVLNRKFIGVEGTSYSDWNNKTAASGAVYAGNSAGGNDAIQLRSTDNAGIVTKISGGKAKSIIVSWNTNTTDGRTLDVYGKSTAYGTAKDLYNNSTQGTKLGSIVCGTSTELVIDGNYEYIGLRSKSGAMYLDEIQIEWYVPYPETVVAGEYYLKPGSFENETCALYAIKFINKNTDAQDWKQGYLNDGFVSFKIDNDYTHMEICVVKNLDTYASSHPDYPQYETANVLDFTKSASFEYDYRSGELEYEAPTGGDIKYFDLDLEDWVTVDPIATGVNRVELAEGIGYAYGVVSAEGAIEVYNVNGAVVARGNDTIDLRGLGRGVYIIRNGNQVRKVVR